MSTSRRPQRYTRPARLTGGPGRPRHRTTNDTARPHGPTDDRDRGEGIDATTDEDVERNGDVDVPPVEDVGAVAMARERAGDYDADGPDDGHGGHGPGPGEGRDPDDPGPGDADDPARQSGPDLSDEDGRVGPGLSDKVGQARQLLGEILELAADEQSPRRGGELAGLLGLLASIDTAQAAAVELATTIRDHDVAERATKLTLEGLLSFQTRAPRRERRTLTYAAGQLPRWPNLRRAFHAGVVGWAEVTSILSQARRLTVEQRALLDGRFDDLQALSRLEPDELLERVAAAVDRLRPDLERKKGQRTIQSRFLSLQPCLDGTGTGYLELDAAAYGTVAASIQAAMGPPAAGPKDITRDAAGQAPTHRPADFSAIGRQRADALVAVCEAFLAGTGLTPQANTHADGNDTSDGDGTAPGNADGTEPGDAGRDSARSTTPVGAGHGLRRARPSIQVVCDVQTLAGNDRTARAAKGLLATIGGPTRLTPDTARRLACDAKLQAIFTDDIEILGTSDPTDRIPVAVRRAVQARDQGCRFPGCTAPTAWCDLHHVEFREFDGPTTVPNLTTLCRRHHTAVHEGGWRLTMTPQGVVTVTRGRRTYSSDPPLRRTLLPD